MILQVQTLQIYKSINIYQPTNQPTNQPIIQPTNQPTNQSINQSINQSTKQASNQAINQSTNQSTNQSINVFIYTYIHLDRSMQIYPSILCYLVLSYSILSYRSYLLSISWKLQENRSDLTILQRFISYKSCFSPKTFPNPPVPIYRTLFCKFNWVNHCISANLYIETKAIFERNSLDPKPSFFWWFRHIWKIKCSSNWVISAGRGDKIKIKPPPRDVFLKIFLWVFIQAFDRFCCNKAGISCHLELPDFTKPVISPPGKPHGLIDLLLGGIRQQDTTSRFGLCLQTGCRFGTKVSVFGIFWTKGFKNKRVPELWTSQRVIPGHPPKVLDPNKW